MIVRSLLLACLAAVITSPITAQQAAQNDFAVRDVRLFDGRTVIENATVVVENGRITAVGTGLSVPEGMRVIEGSGHTLLPGLIDGHVHAFSVEALEQAASFGVTTVLDMFTAPEFLRAVRERQASGELAAAADLRSAGTLVTAEGGHGTQYGLPIPTLDHPADAERFVADRLEEGSDFIKIVHEDGSAYATERPTLSSEIIAAVIRATHAHDRLAVVHVSTLEGARMVVGHGTDGLVHIFGDAPIDEALLDEMAERGTFVIPTLAVLASVSGLAAGAELAGDPRLAPYLPAPERQNLERSFPASAEAQRRHLEHATATVRQLHARGVPILAGTDAPNPGTAFGASMHGELALLVEAGLTATEALAAATAAPAAAFGLDDRGRIAPGMRADLLLVEGDPTEDIEATRRIVQVWKAGRVIERTPVTGVPGADGVAIAPTGMEGGWISRFEDGSARTSFGAGWMESTDRIAGGASTVAMEVTERGAGRSAYALRVMGEVAEGLPFAWSGVMFAPADAPMQPADLSGWTGIALQARGDGREYQLMLFSEPTGPMPVARPFTPSEWGEHTFSFADFSGIDPARLTAVVIAAGLPAGGFELWIDEVRLMEN